MIDKKALQLLLYAQKFYPKEYANFANALEARHIPWDISNDQFTSLLGGFGAQFSFFLSSKNITVDKPAIERVVPTKEVLAPLVAELEQARDSQEQGKHFESNGTKIEKFINAINYHFAFFGSEFNVRTIHRSNVAVSISQINITTVFGCGILHASTYKRSVRFDARH